MAKLETVAICHPLNRDCMIRINKADYIPGKHTLWAEHGAGESSTQPEPVPTEELTAIEVEEPATPTKGRRKAKAVEDSLPGIVQI